MCSFSMGRFRTESHAVKEGRVNKDSHFFSRRCRSLRLPRASVRLTEKREKITPVLRSNQELTDHFCEFFRPYVSVYLFAAPSFRFVCSGSIWVPENNPLSVKEFNETSTFKEDRKVVNSSLKVLGRGSLGDKPLAFKLQTNFTFRLKIDIF